MSILTRKSRPGGTSGLEQRRPEDAGSDQAPNESLVRAMQPRPHPIARPRQPRAEFRRYRWTQAGVPLFLCLYFAIVVWRERIPGQGEVFPFASWSLFSLVPNTRQDYALRLLEVDGRLLASPLFFEEATSTFRGAADHVASVTIDRLGKAFSAGDRLGAERLRRRFETEFLRKEARHVRYELVTRVYDPMERWRTGALREVRTLTEYETGRP